MPLAAFAAILAAGALAPTLFTLRYRPDVGDVLDYRLQIRYSIVMRPGSIPNPGNPKDLDQRADFRVDMRQTIVSVDRDSFTSRITFGKTHYDSAGIFDEAREGMAGFKFEPMTLRTDFRGRQTGLRSANPLPFGGDIPYPARAIAIGETWSALGAPGSYVLWSRGTCLGRPALEVSGNMAMPAEKGTGVFAESRMWIDARDGFMLANSGKIFIRTSEDGAIAISVKAVRQFPRRGSARKS